MKIRLLFAFLVICLGCNTSSNMVRQTSDDSDLRAKADRLAQEYIITDGHVDLPYRLKISNFRLEREFLGIPIETDKGDFDYVRAKKGGLDVPFMSIYIPASNQEVKGQSKALADTLIDMIEGITRAHPDKFAIAHNPAESEAIVSRGLLALPMGMENGAGIEDDLANIDYFRKRGISYITLTHSRDNLICDSSYDTTRTWNGLSPFGREVVREMNRVGVMIDISHVSDQTFYQVMDLTTVPVIASHSSCRKFTPGFERNMSDDMIRRLGQNGGVIQINFGSSFLDGEIQEMFNQRRRDLRALLSSKGMSMGDPGADEVIEAYQKENPSLFADVEKVADHIDHVVALAGIDHVGFGSDYDGVGDSLPTGLKDVSQYPNLIYVLLKRGYSDEDIAKICYKNVWRVWNAVEKAAGRG